MPPLVQLKMPNSLKQILNDIEIETVNKPLMLFIDNQSTIAVHFFINNSKNKQLP